MNVSSHIVLVVVTILAWALFFLLGLPFEYFLTWSVADRILLSLITMFAVLPCIAFFVLSLLGGEHFKTSVWFAFYASVLAFFLDLVVVGLMQGNGIQFLVTHWLQTIGYGYVWVSIPLVGWVLDRVSTHS